MSLPENPQSRGEVFLNAIATGSSSDLPTPQSREEQYLDYIAKNGGGGGSSLPPVTADDKDKFLHTSASDGSLEWAEGGGGGGGGVLVCPCTSVFDAENNDFVRTATMTASALWAAAQTGAVVFTFRDYVEGEIDYSMSCLVSLAEYDPDSPVKYVFVADRYSFVAENGTDYPVYSNGGK